MRCAFNITISLVRNTSAAPCEADVFEIKTFQHYFWSKKKLCSTYFGPKVVLSTNFGQKIVPSFNFASKTMLSIILGHNKVSVNVMMTKIVLTYNRTCSDGLATCSNDIHRIVNTCMWNNKVDIMRVQR